MKTTSTGLAIVLTGLGWTLAPTGGYAASDTAVPRAAMERVCAENGGRFEQSWRYNDQGVQWGAITSCSTSTGYVTCQDDFCRGTRRVGSAAVVGRSHPEGGVTFRAEPATIASVLAGLVGK